MYLDMTKEVESKIAFYAKDIDNPFSVNGFRGTWAISDHNLIPSVFNGFLQRHFGVMRLKRIKLDEINALLNELWDGPGSLAKIFRLENDLYNAGANIKFSPLDIAKIKKYEEDDEQELDDLPLAQFAESSDDDDE
jgi:hypothetical protein